MKRFARWWTPGAMRAALLVILVPPLLFGGDWWTWTYRSLALLLIACSCALVISVPAAVASGLSAEARRGLLVKGGAALEAIGAAPTVAFDKIGTLTECKPRVTDMVPLRDGTNENHMLAYAAAVTMARAVEAAVGGRRVAVASPQDAAEAGPGLDKAALAYAEGLEADGKTVVVVLVNVEPYGMFAMGNEPRADVAAGIALLRILGVRAVMLTSDKKRTGRAIAGALGMDVRTGLLPEDKLREIAVVKAQGPVVMVGDGTNDAPALAAASVGVAMGGGTDMALENVDAALMGDRMRRCRAAGTIADVTCQHPAERRRGRRSKGDVSGDHADRDHRAVAGDPGGHGDNGAGDDERLAFLAPALRYAAYSLMDAGKRAMTALSRRPFWRLAAEGPTQRRGGIVTFGRHGRLA